MRDIVKIGGIRGMLVLLSGILLSGMVSCGGGGMDPHLTDGAKRAPAQLTVQSSPAGVDVTIDSGAKDVETLTFIFVSGEQETQFVSGKRPTLHSANTSPLSHLHLSSKSGEYWYFDNSGNWLPDGYQPQFSVSSYNGKGAAGISIISSTLSVVSTDTMCEVKVGFANGSIQTFQTSSIAASLQLTQSFPNVEAIMVKVVADGSKWYFDRYGNNLPLDSKWYQDLD